MTDGPASRLAARLAEVERRLARLEARDAAGAGEPSGREPASPATGDRFWALDALRRIAPHDGGVLFTGTVETADGRAEWQYGRTTGDLLERDWAEHAGTLAALGHPVRLALLHAVLTGTRTVAELTARKDTGTTGQVYHHLRQLVAVGWLRHASGRYQVPAERVVPLLTVLAATER